MSLCRLVAPLLMRSSLSLDPARWAFVRPTLVSGLGPTSKELFKTPELAQENWTRQAGFLCGARRSSLCA
jgi:hypothetical protein